MIKKIFLTILFLFLLADSVGAVYDPLSVPNNRYGIHVADPGDISELATLLNSNGGDWGYVTLVIQENDRDVSKWQRIFDQMRRLHLIPLVRLATRPEGDCWLKPDKEQLKPWVEFLSSLNWPIKNRYVIIFNEPNHAKEWGGNLDPEDYAQVLISLGSLLKTASSDYFILPAGLDVSATNNNQSMSADLFLKRMVQAQPEILNLIDGWTSHSYPNPAFSASPLKQGRGSLSSFRWELNFLKSLGIGRQLPVFITETGWVHSQGKQTNQYLLSPDKVAENFLVASENIWSDPQIVAITPFIFNYQDIPFDHFSFKVLGASDYYSHYYAYQEMEKDKGQPKQEEKYQVLELNLPQTLITNSIYKLTGQIENQGQAILDPEDFYQLAIDKRQEFVLVGGLLTRIEPGEKADISFTLKTPKTASKLKLSLYLQHRQDNILLKEQELTLISPPELSVKTKLAFGNKAQTDSASVWLFDEEGKMVRYFTDLKIDEGILTLPPLKDFIPEKQYTVKIRIPSYLPLKKDFKLSPGKIELTMAYFLPLDFNQDGQFSLADFLSLLPF